MTDTLEVTEWREQQRPNLGRQLVHDERSRSFAARLAVDRSQWRDKLIRIYDPSVNPDQCHGECTGCAKSMEFNAIGNRIKSVVLDMDDAHNIYGKATTLDPFKGTWPPKDTGSSGLASCKAAQQLGLGGEYRWLFGGADEVVQTIMEGHVVNVGTWWYEHMFYPDRNGVIQTTGENVGGHQYIVRGYDKANDRVMIRCWWGKFRDAWLPRALLNELLMDGGDAHIQDRLK